MALTLIKELDEITVSFNGIVMVREVRKVMQENAVISEGYHRYSLSPGEDISNEPDRVQRLCNAVWTAEVIASFKEQMQQMVPGNN